ncbi:MAG: hypothetical protein Q8N53_14885 [Longimicrobiales bacterium]|nr:hypothetical protein [Longimicrobiales bacterium]
MSPLRKRGPGVVCRCLAACLLAQAMALELAAQSPRALLPIDFTSSAEYGWLQKKVHASRTLDDLTQASTWRFTGTGRLTFPVEPRMGGMRVLRVDMQMFTDAPAPTSNRLSSVNLRRPFDNEDWTGYNRLSLWIRAEVTGFPMLPLQLVLHNEAPRRFRIRTTVRESTTSPWRGAAGIMWCGRSSPSRGIA